MTTKDMKTTLSLIHDFWPEFTITIEDLQSPTSNFVTRFCRKFVSEFNEKISFLTGEDIVNDTYEHAQEFSVVYLYTKVANIFKKMNYTSFNVNDIYFPQSKRIHAAVKYSIHCLIYVNNVLDDLSNICNEVYKKDMQLGDLNNLKQQCLQDIAENAEILARSQDVYEELEKKLNVAETRYLQMKEDKGNKEKIEFEKLTEQQVLQGEIDNLDYELSDLEGKEKDLREQIVSVENFKNLKHLGQHLELKHEQIIEEGLAIGCEVDQQIEMMKYADENGEDLKNCNFSSLHVDDLHRLEEEAKPLQNMTSQLKNELLTLNNEKRVKVDNVNKKIQKEEEGQKVVSELQAKNAQDFEIFKKRCDEECARQAAKFEEYQRLTTESNNSKEEIKKAEDTEKQLKHFVLQKYKKVLDTASSSTRNYNKMLINLKSQK